MLMFLHKRTYLILNRLATYYMTNFCQIIFIFIINTIIVYNNIFI